jgi:hypothetical protein
MNHQVRQDANSAGRDAALYAKAEQLLRGNPLRSGQQGLEVLVSAAEAAVRVSGTNSAI